MELKLSYDELRGVLLEWAARRYPGEFDEVIIDAGYSSVRYAKFLKEEVKSPPLKEVV